MNDYYSLDFLGKECKNDSHTLCSGQWKGLGVKVSCNCHCHRKQVLEKDVLYHDNSDESDVITELIPIGEFKNDSNS